MQPQPRPIFGTCTYMNAHASLDCLMALKSSGMRDAMATFAAYLPTSALLGCFAESSSAPYDGSIMTRGDLPPCTSMPGFLP